MRTRVLVFLSDTHCGSTLGLMHPEGAYLDDGQHVEPSALQGYLWDTYMRFIDDTKRIIADEHDPTTHLFLNGDLVDGWHHGTHQRVSGSDDGVDIQIACDVLEGGILNLDFETIHMTRGTPAHVKRAAGLEKAVANRLHSHGHPIVRCDKIDSFLWPFVYAEFNGMLLDVRHHGKTSSLARMRKSHASNYAQDIWQLHVNEGKRPPDIAVRSHRHVYVDSGPDTVRGMTRLIQTPCWQFSSEWVRSRSIDSRPDIGGVVVVVRTGRTEVVPLVYTPEPDPQPIWRPTE